MASLDPFFIGPVVGLGLGMALSWIKQLRSPIRGLLFILQTVALALVGAFIGFVVPLGHILFVIMRGLANCHHC
jgi:hypothetical protein